LERSPTASLSSALTLPVLTQASVAAAGTAIKNVLSLSITDDHVT